MVVFRFLNESEAHKFHEWLSKAGLFGLEYERIDWDSSKPNCVRVRVK